MNILCIFEYACSIYGCSVSHPKEYRGISLIKVPSGKTEFDKKWRDQLTAIITKDLVIDQSLRSQIDINKLFICQRHFRDDQYYRHDTKCTLNPGVIPTLNLPQKSHPPSSTVSKPRDSADIINQKRSLNAATATEYKINDCYSSFSEFKTRVESLKLNGWQVTSQNKLVFTHHDGVHSVPKFEIYVDDQLNFALRCLLWNLSAKHELYCSYNKSVKNITISNLLHHVSSLKSLKLCSGLSNQYSEACIEHSVPKIFSSNLLSSTSFPLHQSKWYRSPNCNSGFLILLSSVCELSRY